MGKFMNTHTEDMSENIRLFLSASYKIPDSQWLNREGF